MPATLTDIGSVRAELALLKETLAVVVRTVDENFAQQRELNELTGQTLLGLGDSLRLIGEGMESDFRRIVEAAISDWATQAEKNKRYEDWLDALETRIDLMGGTNG